jgi:hypothetical protein
MPFSIVTGMYGYLLGNNMILVQESKRLVLTLVPRLWRLPTKPRHIACVVPGSNALSKTGVNAPNL